MPKMFDKLRHDWRLRRLQAQKPRVYAEYDERVRLAREQKKPQDEIERLRYAEHMDIEIIDDEIWLLHSQYLTGKAARYLIPTPEFKTKGGAWMESSITGKWRLTPEAISELRTAIRNEEKERRDRWLAWIPLISALTGLVGVLAALASLLRK